MRNDPALVNVSPEYRPLYALRAPVRSYARWPGFFMVRICETTAILAMGKQGYSNFTIVRILSRHNHGHRVLPLKNKDKTLSILFAGKEKCVNLIIHANLPISFLPLTVFFRAPVSCIVFE